MNAPIDSRRLESVASDIIAQYADDTPMEERVAMRWAIVKYHQWLFGRRMAAKTGSVPPADCVVGFCNRVEQYEKWFEQEVPECPSYFLMRISKQEERALAVPGKGPSCLRLYVDLPEECKKIPGAIGMVSKTVLVRYDLFDPKVLEE